MAAGKRLRRILGLRNMRQKSPGVQEHAVPTDRHDDRHPVVANLFSQIQDLADAGVNVIVLHGFLDPARHRFHVSPGHASVGVQAFVHDHHVAGLFDIPPDR